MSLHKLTLKEIRKATENFNDKVSEDISGKIYNGKFEHQYKFGPHLHAKELDIQVSKEDWRKHVKSLDKLSGKRLAKLFGYCDEEGHRILVYRYKRGSLNSKLFPKSASASASASAEPLSWTERLRVARGACKGLKFLLDQRQRFNTKCINTSNILISYSGKAMLTVHFNPGTGGENVEGDVVYEYGLVLLEILTCNTAIGEEVARWVARCNDPTKSRDDIVRLMDKRLEGQYSKVSALTAASLALQCLHRQPTISSVREELIVLKKFDVAFRASKTSTVKHMRSDR